MDKLTKCRICLVENVRMHVVTDSHLQEIFEKLTNIPFITEDSRPMLGCFFCYARLKQCYKFKQKCLDSEAKFTQMLSEEYEQKPILAELESFGGFLISPIEHFSTEDLVQQEDKREDKEDIREELMGGCEKIEHIELKAEYHSDVSEQESIVDSNPGFGDNPHTQSEDDIPLTRMTTEVEQVIKKRRTTKKEGEAKEESSTGMFKNMSKKQLYDIIQECPDKKIDKKILFLEKKVMKLTNCPDSEIGQLKHSLSHFKSEFKQKWTAANYKHDRFMRKNELWLTNTIKFAIWVEKQGRPTKEFGESSDRSKRRKTKDLRESVPAEQLTYAAHMSQRAKGNKDMSKTAIL